MKLYESLNLKATFNEYTLCGEYAKAKYDCVLGTSHGSFMKFPFYVGLRNLHGPVHFNNLTRGQGIGRYEERLKSAQVVQLAPLQQTTCSSIINYALGGKRIGFVSMDHDASKDMVLKYVRPEAPSLFDVLHCLCSDASVLDYQSFEQWASEYGYSPDSRSAEKTYHACMELSLKLQAAVGGKQALTELQEYVRSIDELGEEEAKKQWEARNQPEAATLDELIKADELARLPIQDKAWELLKKQARDILKKHSDVLQTFDYAGGHPTPGQEYFFPKRWHEDSQDNYDEYCKKLDAANEDAAQWAKDYDKFETVFGCYRERVQFTTDGKEVSGWSYGVGEKS